MGECSKRRRRQPHGLQALEGQRADVVVRRPPLAADHEAALVDALHRAPRNGCAHCPGGARPPPNRVPPAGRRARPSRRNRRAPESPARRPGIRGGRPCGPDPRSRRSPAPGARSGRWRAASGASASSQSSMLMRSRSWRRGVRVPAAEGQPGRARWPACRAGPGSACARNEPVKWKRRGQPAAAQNGDAPARLDEVELAVEPDAVPRRPCADRNPAG